MTNKAREFAIKWHGDQMYGDKPYVYHLDQVAAEVKRLHTPYDKTSQLLQTVAYCHDLLEDTGCEYEDLGSAFGWTVAEAVLLLTKTQGLRYDYYISRIKNNFYALGVKIADTKANLKQSILDNDKNRIVKYAKQLMLLEERDVTR